MTAMDNNQRLQQLRDAIRAQTIKTREAITQLADARGIKLRQRRRHCLCPGDLFNKSCDVEFVCHQLSGPQADVVRAALRDVPRLAYIFDMAMPTWSHDDHVAILECRCLHRANTR